MPADIGTNPDASASEAGVQATNQPGYESGAGVADADQGGLGQSEGDQNLDGSEGESGPELEEFEYEGLKHALPKAWKPLLDKGLDYTRKTQEHAEHARQFEQQFASREQQFAQREQAARVLHQGRATLAAYDMQLAPYVNVNWALATQQDRDAANTAWMQMSQLKDERAKLEKQLEAAESRYLEDGRNQSSERVRSVVSKWTPEEVQNVSEVGSQVYGITPQHMALFGANPALLTILKDAVAHQVATRKAAESTKKAAPEPVKPAAKLPQGRGGPPKTMDDPGLSTEEWMKRRNEQVRRKR